MANPAPDDIVVTAEHNPAIIKIGPWQTFDAFHADGALHAHHDAPSPGIKKTLISGDESCFPITIKFTQHNEDEAPVAEAVFPDNATEVN